MKTHNIPTIIFWILSCVILAYVACFWIIQGGHYSRMDPERSNTAQCIINIRNMQAAVRVYQSENGLQPGSPLSIDELINKEIISNYPSCPDGQSYLCDNVIPKEDYPYLRCLNPKHNEFDHKNW